VVPPCCPKCSHLLLMVVSNLPMLVTKSSPLIILITILINEPVVLVGHMVNCYELVEYRRWWLIIGCP